MPTSAFKAASRALFLSCVAIAVDLLRSRLQHTPGPLWQSAFGVPFCLEVYMIVTSCYDPCRLCGSCLL